MELQKVGRSEIGHDVAIPVGHWRTEVENPNWSELSKGTEDRRLLAIREEQRTYGMGHWDMLHNCINEYRSCNRQTRIHKVRNQYD